MVHQTPGVGSSGAVSIVRRAAMAVGLIQAVADVGWSAQLYMYRQGTPVTKGRDERAQSDSTDQSCKCILPVHRRRIGNRQNYYYADDAGVNTFRDQTSFVSGLPRSTSIPLRGVLTVHPKAGSRRVRNRYGALQRDGMWLRVATTETSEILTDEGHSNGVRTQPPTHINHRTFVGGTVAAGGVVVALPLLQGCSNDEPAATQDGTSVRMSINGRSGKSPSTIARRCSTCCANDRLTGTKKGCDQGACGACTVLINDQRVVSCLTLAVMVEGAEVTTIEGVARDGDLHPLQQAFIDEDGLQCGSCTPGQIMSGIGCIRQGHTSTPGEIREWMKRQHLPVWGLSEHCGRWPRWRGPPRTERDRMFPFEFSGASDESAALEAGLSGARYIAGGTTLVDLMRETVERPEAVVDINALPYATSTSTRRGCGWAPWRGWQMWLPIRRCANFRVISEALELRRHPKCATWPRSAATYCNGPAVCTCAMCPHDATGGTQGRAVRQSAGTTAC